MNLTEHGLQTRIRDAVNRIPGLLLRRRQVGRFLAISGGPRVLQTAIEILASRGIAVRVVDVGDNGEADLQGLAWHGRGLAVEVKSEHGQLSEAQENWRRNIWERRGGVYLVAQTLRGDDGHGPAVDRVLQNLEVYR